MCFGGLVSIVLYSGGYLNLGLDAFVRSFFPPRD